MGPVFLEFAIENYSEMFGHINTGNFNIRIHRDIEGEMWFVGGVDANNLSKISVLYTQSYFLG